MVRSAFSSCSSLRRVWSAAWCDSMSYSGIHKDAGSRRLMASRVTGDYLLFGYNCPHLISMSMTFGRCKSTPLKGMATTSPLARLLM